jgi:hypothetical protein
MAQWAQCGAVNPLQLQAAAAVLQRCTQAAGRGIAAVEA